MDLGRKFFVFVSTLIVTIAIAIATSNLLLQNENPVKADLDSFLTPSKSQVLPVKAIENSTTDLELKALLQQTKKENQTNQQKSLKAVFPLGWYDTVVTSETPAKVSPEGIGFLLPYLGNSNKKTIRTYLDAADAAGLKVILEVPRTMVRRGWTFLLTDFVRTFKNHRAVFAWYLYDEPEYVGISPKILKKSYDAIKAENPNKPVAIVFANSKAMAKYKDSMDIPMLDFYPVRYNSKEFAGFEKFRFRNKLKTAITHAQGKKPLWFVIQSFGKLPNRAPNENWRFPTLKEWRYMFYTAVATGYDGILFWTYYRAQPAWVNAVVTPTIKEFLNYIPAIKAGALPNAVKVNRSDIQVALYQAPISKSYFLIAVHHGQNKVKANFELMAPRPRQEGTINGENRSIALSNGKFSDSFDAYAVRVYAMQ